MIHTKKFSSIISAHAQFHQYIYQINLHTRVRTRISVRTLFIRNTYAYSRQIVSIERERRRMVSTEWENWKQQHQRRQHTAPSLCTMLFIWTTALLANRIERIRRSLYVNEWKIIEWVRNILVSMWLMTEKLWLRLQFNMNEFLKLEIT